jgi:hypothetical protein
MRHVDPIDDADDRGIDRHEPGIAGQGRLARADQVDEIAIARLHGVDRGMELADRRTVLVDRLDEQQLLALETSGLALRDHTASDDAQVHGRKDNAPDGLPSNAALHAFSCIVRLAS